MLVIWGPFPGRLNHSNEICLSAISLNRLNNQHARSPVCRPLEIYLLLNGRLHCPDRRIGNR